MSEHYDFHYQPTGSGAISGQQVLQQTEDAINELGDYVNDNVGGAMDVAQQALETAQNAEQDAQTALDTANSFSSAIQSAQQDASTALSTAQTAQTTASNANNTAIQAQQDASSAVTTANNASGQVSTLSGTVTALGQRVTTAEGNIGQNTSDITALTTRVGTAEGNITTLQNDVTIAQGNASSAMATAGTVKQQAFVFRYSSTALVASSTNSNALLDNTDNLKVGDKVIDSDGVLFSITAIDTQNSTFTIGTALIDLANDSDVMHLSGNETIGGEKTFSDYLATRMLTATGMYISDEGSNNRRTVLKLLAGSRDTDGYSCSYITRVRPNKAQGALISSDVQTLGFDFVENQVRTLNTFIIRATNWSNDVPKKIEFTSNISDYTYGSSTNKAKINDLNPGSLSFPDLDNGVDISSYLDTSQNSRNYYTPSVNGWISIKGRNPSGSCGVAIIQGDMATNGYNLVDFGVSDRLAFAMLPVVANTQVEIWLKSVTSLDSAKFFPCQGNV